MALNPQILGLLSQSAASGNVNPLATILAQGGGLPPTSIAASQQPFPVPPQGAGRGGSGVLGGAAGAPSSLPAAAQAAPQALAAAAPLGGGAGAALPGGLPNTPGPAAPAAPGGVNPLAALVPPTAGQQQRPPQPIAPRGGGQINPQIMQMIMQVLGAGGQPQQPAQSLGTILGGLR